jgi:hypothetical protein
MPQAKFDSVRRKAKYAKTDVDNLTPAQKVNYMDTILDNETAFLRLPDRMKWRVLFRMLRLIVNRLLA